MSLSQREQIAVAILALLQGAYQWNQPVSRRLVLWSAVDAAQRPAAFFIGVGEDHEKKNPTLVKRSFNYKVYIYINGQPADDPTTSGNQQFNDIISSLEAALAPSGGDLFTGRNTLGGLVSHVAIEGKLAVDPGDLDGDGVAIIPITVLVP